MSVYQGHSSILSINPRIDDDGDVIEVRTHRLLQALALGSYCQRAVIDSQRRQIEIQKRRLWLWTTTRTISFCDVDHLRFKYSDFATSWTMRERADTIETYRVGVILKHTGEVLWLASFRGEGASMTGLHGVLLGDTLVDLAGTQGNASRSLVDRLAEMIGVGLSRPMLDRPTLGEWACRGCERGAPPRAASCIYCGDVVEHLGRAGKARVARGTPSPDRPPRSPYGAGGGTAL